MANNTRLIGALTEPAAQARGSVAGGWFVRIFLEAPQTVLEQRGLRDRLPIDESLDHLERRPHSGFVVVLEELHLATLLFGELETFGNVVVDGTSYLDAPASPEHTVEQPLAAALQVVWSLLRDVHDACAAAHDRCLLVRALLARRGLGWLTRWLRFR
jgi:hypothetical protein